MRWARPPRGVDEPISAPRGRTCAAHPRSAPGADLAGDPSARDQSSRSGVVLAWFLGWILAKSMLETRGLAWAWFIHFVQDMANFGFMAIGAITPGGG